MTKFLFFAFLAVFVFAFITNGGTLLRTKPYSWVYSEEESPPKFTDISSADNFEAAPTSIKFFSFIVSSLKNGDQIRSFADFKTFALRHYEFNELLGMSPYPVYIEGPHSFEGLELSSNRFGYYNPLFLKWLEAQMEAMFANQKFVDFTAPSVHQKAGYFIRKLSLAERAIDEQENYSREIVLSDLLGEKRVAFSANISREDEVTKTLRHRFGREYLAFWARRHRDTTADEFRRLLQLIIKTYEIDDSPFNDLGLSPIPSSQSFEKNSHLAPANTIWTPNGRTELPISGSSNRELEQSFSILFGK